MRMGTASRPQHGAVQMPTSSGPDLSQTWPLRVCTATSPGPRPPIPLQHKSQVSHVTTNDQGQPTAVTRSHGQPINDQHVHWTLDSQDPHPHPFPPVPPVGQCRKGATAGAMLLSPLLSRWAARWASLWATGPLLGRWAARWASLWATGPLLGDGGRDGPARGGRAGGGLVSIAITVP